MWQRGCCRWNVLHSCDFSAKFWLVQSLRQDNAESLTERSPRLSLCLGVIGKVAFAAPPGGASGSPKCPATEPIPTGCHAELPSVSASRTRVVVAQNHASASCSLASRPPVTLQQMFAVSQVETGRCDLAAFFLHRDMLRQCLPITSPTGATARATRGGRRTCYRKKPGRTAAKCPRHPEASAQSIGSCHRRRRRWGARLSSPAPENVIIGVGDR